MKQLTRQYSYIDSRFECHRSQGQHKLYLNSLCLKLVQRNFTRTKIHYQLQCKYSFLRKNNFVVHDNCSWPHSLIHQIHHHNFQSRRTGMTDGDNLDFLLNKFKVVLESHLICRVRWYMAVVDDKQHYLDIFTLKAEEMSFKVTLGKITIWIWFVRAVWAVIISIAL